MTDALLRCFVPGRPRTKGSMRPVKSPTGRVKLVEEVKESGPWRNEMARAIMPHVAERIVLPTGPAWQLRPGYPHDGPVRVALEFFLPRVDADNEDEWPTDIRLGDVDKLTRNVLDVLSAPVRRGQASVGVIRDDALVCDLTVSKRLGPVAGEQSGVGIEVWRLAY